jgi:fumarate reductase flavoprotein subunit
VLAQPGGVAWCLYDARLHALGLTFADYRVAHDHGAIVGAAGAAELARTIGVPPDALARTLAFTREAAAGRAQDRHGRDFTGAPALGDALYSVRVTGALFHTQGGLCIDTRARVLDPQHRPLPGLYAGGGAARGVSGAHVWGYLSGNGLLSAVVTGALAGRDAALHARQMR